MFREEPERGASLARKHRVGREGGTPSSIGHGGGPRLALGAVCVTVPFPR